MPEMKNLKLKNLNTIYNIIKIIKDKFDKSYATFF